MDTDTQRDRRYIPRDWFSAVFSLAYGGAALAGGVYFIFTGSMRGGRPAAIIWAASGVALLYCGGRVAANRARLWYFWAIAFLLIGGSIADGWFFGRFHWWPKPFVLLVLIGWAIPIFRDRRSSARRGRAQVLQS